MDTDDIPSWLQPHQPPIEEPYSFNPLEPSLALTRLPTHPRTKEERELVTQTYEKVFYLSLDKVMAGQSLRFLAGQDHRQLNVGKFMNWVKSDPQRNKQFEEAQAVAAEVLMLEAAEIAEGSVDANGNPSAIDRDKLRLDTRYKLASFWNPRKYGDVKRVEMTTKDITDKDLDTLSLDELQRLVVEGEFAIIDEQPSTSPSTPI